MYLGELGAKRTDSIQLTLELAQNKTPDKACIPRSVLHTE